MKTSDRLEALYQLLEESVQSEAALAEISEEFVAPVRELIAGLRKDIAILERRMEAREMMRELTPEEQAEYDARDARIERECGGWYE